MSLLTWSRWLFRSRLKTHSAARRTRTWRVEQLEARWMLAGLAIDTNNYSAARILVSFTDPNASNNVAPLANGLQWGRTFSLVPGLRELSVGAGWSVTQALSTVRSLRNVAYAEPDYRVTADATPNDTSFGSLWGLNNIGQSGGRSDADVDAPEAWNTSTGSGNFVVGIIDTGIDYNHPDLAANMWTNPGEIAGNGIDDDRNGYVDDLRGYDFANNDADPMDDNGHGTHVAGTIGAVGNNGVGVTGVNWRVKMAALKFLDASGSGYTSDAVRALDYAVAKGIRVTNNSWGGGGDSSSLRTAIQRAQTAGSIFVAAAGNDGQNTDVTVSYPASYSYDNIVSVAATDRNDALASFSNYGATTVDIAAPGVSILSTTPNNTYSTYNGTSMATPHVTGVVALVWDRNPTWTYRQVINQVLSTADPVTGLSGKVATGGRLNAAKAIGAANITPDTTGPFIVTASPSLTVSAPVSSVTFTFSEPIAAGTFTAADVVSFTNATGQDIRSSITGVTGSGTTWTVNFTQQVVNGYYPIIVGPNITDLAGNLLDQNRNNVKGESPADQYGVYFQITGSTVGTPTTFTNAVATAITDRATITSSLVVSAAGTINDLNVGLNVRHTYDGDLIVRLIAPDNTTITLVNRRGGSGDNFTNTVFDSEASTSITAARAPFTGSFRPEGSLSVLRNKNIAGTWKLQITDAATFDTGTLLSWSLIVTPNATAASGSTRSSSMSTSTTNASSELSRALHNTQAWLAAWDQAFRV